jgi:2-polyprenyl-3-methyl-5-hydroxy-6-metoxy-1,4-benzoquinol methylase
MMQPHEKRRVAIRSERYEQRRLRLIADLVEGPRVLDLGYAAMPNAGVSARDVVGFDLDRPLDVPSNYTEHAAGDVMELSEVLGGRQFDTVLCGELIEHVERPYDLLREIHRVLEPGGLLLLTTPNPVAWPPLLAEWTSSRRYLFTEEHTYYFAPRWVVRMLERTEFVVERTKSVGFWLPFGVVPWCPVALSYQVLFASRKPACSRAPTS